jgi:hypothetical protein
MKALNDRTYCHVLVGTPGNFGWLELVHEVAAIPDLVQPPKSA